MDQAGVWGAAVPSVSRAAPHDVDIGIAGPEDVPELAQLQWLHAGPHDQQQTAEAFSVDLGRWWGNHRESHYAFVARGAGRAVVGMAWVALAPRVPRPGTIVRHCGDIQSVFVVPEHRGRGIGSSLVLAAAEHALQLGASRVTVQSSRWAVPVYERLGFASSPQLLRR